MKETKMGRPPNVETRLRAPMLRHRIESAGMSLRAFARAAGYEHCQRFAARVIAGRSQSAAMLADMEAKAHDILSTHTTEQ